MNILWCLLIVLSLILLVFQNPGLAFSALLNGSENAISLSIKLWAIYALWLGLLKIVEETKLCEKISRLLSPIIKFLFGKLDKQTSSQISLNITSNLLGLGNASIPSGIKAMENLSKNEDYLTTSMLMLTILNSCNLQILPSTIISLRESHGSLNSLDIILPNLLVSLISLSLGILLVKIYGMIKNCIVPNKKPKSFKKS